MLRIGHGYDVHRLVENRDLIIGGVEIDYHLGLLGHSDADVLAHAVMDALLGAAGLRDIGYIFPDNDMNFKNADSMNLLKIVSNMIKRKGYKISNIDSTIIAQKPKLSGYIEQMTKNISNSCSLAFDRVNVKATTEETLGFTGRLEGVSAHAVALLIKNNTNFESNL